jgi:Mg2+ and Co2+ transporter CorA
MNEQDVKDIFRNPKAMMFRMAQIVCSDWNILVRYIMARLGQIEWELERPDFRPNSNTSVAASLDKLHTWRRRLPSWKTMIKETQERLFGELITGPQYNLPSKVSGGTLDDDCLSRLKKDFDVVESELVELWNRTERIATVATAVTSIEESRSAMAQNSALGRLTYLAVIFAPLSFISSFFSMAPELGELTTTIWIYFVVAVPVSIIAFLLVEPSVLKWMKSFLPDHRKKEKKP